MTVGRVRSRARARVRARARARARARVSTSVSTGLPLNMGPKVGLRYSVDFCSRRSDSLASAA